MALPSPFPLTYGGTTIPAKGIAGGLEIGDGLSGQEVQRAELLSLNLGVGIADRISVSGAVYQRDAFNVLSGEPSGSVWRVKARLGDVFGPRSSVSASVAVASVDREDLPAQKESLHTVDLAAPVEFLLTDPARRLKGSTYVGPRVTMESYRDHLDSRQDLSNVYAGVLGGVHLSYGVLHLFGEATLLYVPKSTYHDVSYGGRMTVMPAAGVLVRIGREHKWPGR